MKYIHKILPRIRVYSLLTLFTLSIIVSTLSSVILANPASALANPSDYSSVNLPDPSNSSREYGVWLNRTAIYLVGAVVKPPGGGEADEVFVGPGIPEKAKQNDVYAPNKDVKYTSKVNPQRSITVNFPGYGTGPTVGHYVDGSGNKLDITLLQTGNAKIDGYFYEDSSNGDKKTVYMPHYIGGIDGCGSGITDGKNAAKYYKDGEFTDDDGNGDYGINDPSGGNNKNARVNNLKKIDRYNSTATQYTKSGGDLGGDCTMGIDNKDNGKSSRTIYLVNTTIDSAKNSLGELIDNFRSEKQRIDKLTRYFDTSATGRAAITTCKDKAGSGTWKSMTQAQVVNLIATSPPASNPFLVCMYKELDGDAAFTEAATFKVEGEWNTDLLDERGGSSCSGTIPIIGDLICYMVRWVFDVINTMFTSVIDFFAQPPDVFTSKVNTQFDDIIAGLRNVANVIFVLAFLMVVLQYLTGFNVADAYFIKKFIPRLVIAVVLVQASGFIVKEMNSFFYDLGTSIQSIIFFGSGLTQGGTTSGVADGITTILAFGGGPAIVGFLLLIGIVMLLVLLITIIILAIRYVAILLLAILAPLALACIAIPQLEGLTKKWFKTYVQLLMMYPIIMLVLASSVIIGQTMNSGNIIMQMMGLIVQFIPYLILPFTFKFAGGMMGNISGKLQGMATKKGKEAYGKTNFAQNRAANKSYKDSERGEAAQRRLNTRAASGRIGRFGKPLSQDQIEIAKARHEQDQLRVPSAKQAAEKATVDAQRFKINETFKKPEYQSSPVEKERYLDEMLKSGDVAQQKAAFEHIVGQGDVGKLQAMQRGSIDGTGPIDAATWNTLQSANYGELKSMDASLAGDVYDNKSVISPPDSSGRPTPPTDVAKNRVKAMRGLDAKGLAAQKKDALAAYHQALQDLASDPTARDEAGNRYDANEARNRVDEIVKSKRDVADTVSEEKKRAVGL